MIIKRRTTALFANLFAALIGAAITLAPARLSAQPSATPPVALPATPADPHPQAGQEFRPEWRLGDTWVVEARYRNLAEAADAWLPPVRWRFHVRSRKEIAGEPCWMLHIVPLGRPDMKVQGVLWLSCRDLRPMRAADVFPVRGIARSRKREFDGKRITPLFSEGSMIPYDVPLFPLADDRGDRRGETGGATVAGEKAVTAAETTFVDQVTQSWKRIPGGFEVHLNDGGAKGVVRQVWRHGFPWAVRHSGLAVEARLVEPMPPEAE